MSFSFSFVSSSLGARVHFKSRLVIFFSPFADGSYYFAADLEASRGKQGAFLHLPSTWPVYHVPQKDETSNFPHFD